jgi:hypothetical protein
MTEDGDILADFMQRRIAGKAARQAFEARHIQLLGICRDAADEMHRAGGTPPHIVLVLSQYAEAIRRQRVE